MIARVEVYQDGSFQRTLDIVDGNVRIRDEAVRRSCDCWLIDELGDLTPDDATDLLAPAGTELHVYRGIDFKDGTSELLRLGVFRISDVKISSSGSAVRIAVDGYDRARTVSKSKLTDEYGILSGTNVKDAIKYLILSRLPTLTTSSAFEAYVTTATTGTLVLKTGDDPWQFARGLAREALSADLFFDNDGNLTLVDIVDPSQAAAVWTYAEGVEAMILSANKRYHDEATYNHVVVSGEHPDFPPIRAEARDDNPSSPTYYLGRFGDVVVHRYSQFIYTQAQGDSYAAAELNKGLGIEEEVHFTSVVHPGHDVDDIVAVVESKAKIGANYVLDSLTIPLVPDRALTTSTRKRRV